MKNLKKHLSLLAIVVALSFNSNSQNTFYGKVPVTKISEAINQKQTVHIIDIWELEEIKAENKAELLIEAIQYKSNNSTDILKGVKLTLFSENGGGEDNVAKSSSQFEAYIDESEYAEVIVAINQIINDIKAKESKDQHGSMFYTTKGGVKFGHLNSKKKTTAFLSFIYSNAEIKSEYSNAKKFFEELKAYIDAASKDLYLPENREKMKNVKKSTQEAKDVIIDDI